MANDQIRITVNRDKLFDRIKRDADAGYCGNECAGDPSQPTREVYEILGDMFSRYHRDTCYPQASADEREIAARGLVAALTVAGYRIVKERR